MNIRKIIREELENMDKLNIHLVIGRFLQDINKKYPTNKNETNVITLEGNDLVVYNVWEEQWENSNWTELERIKINDL